MGRGQILVRGPGILAGVLLLALAGTAISHLKARATRVPATYSLILEGQRAAVDAATGMRAELRSLRSVAPTGTSTIRLTVRVFLHNEGRRPRVIHRGDVFVVDRTGRSYTAGQDSTGSVTIVPGGTAVLAVKLDVPPAIRWLEVEWNDGGRLLPPARLAIVRVFPTGGDGRS